MLDVPRGATVIGLRFNEIMSQAIEKGWKTETRRPLTAKNSRLTRGHFADLDLNSGRPDGLHPVSSLKCRIDTGGDRRSVTVLPRVRANMFLWPRLGQGGPRAKRENATVLMRVRQVEARRLCDITEAEARAEGIMVLMPPTIAPNLDPSEDLVNELAYGFLLEQVGRRTLARWIKGPVHQDLIGRHPTARDCFALMWEWFNGMGSWQANPWVWRYVFAVVPQPRPECTGDKGRDGTGDGTCTALGCPRHGVPELQQLVTP